MQSQEQRRLMRQDNAVEGALPAKHHHAESSRKKYVKKNRPTSSENSANNQNKGKGKKKIIHLVSIAENWVTHHTNVGNNQTQSADAKCSKCNQFGHETIICRSKIQQHEVNAQVVEKEEEDYIFAATCYSMRSRDRKSVV